MNLISDFAKTWHMDTQLYLTRLTKQSYFQLGPTYINSMGLYVQSVQKYISIDNWPFFNLRFLNLYLPTNFHRLLYIKTTQHYQRFIWFYSSNPSPTTAAPPQIQPPPLPYLEPPPHTQIQNAVFSSQPAQTYHYFYTDINSTSNLVYL